MVAHLKTAKGGANVKHSIFPFFKILVLGKQFSVCVCARVCVYGEGSKFP